MMKFIDRDAQGKITALYAVQQVYPLQESIDDQDPEVQAYLNPPAPVSEVEVLKKQIAELQTQLKGRPDLFPTFVPTPVAAAVEIIL